MAAEVYFTLVLIARVIVVLGADEKVVVLIVKLAGINMRWNNFRRVDFYV